MNMKSFLKKLPIFILIGIGIGLSLGLISSFATEEQLEVITPVLTLIMVAALILIFTYTILKAIKINKEANRLLKILYEDIDAENYIKETKDAISKIKNKSYKLHFS